MKNYVYDVKDVNTVNFIIDDLLRPVTMAVLVFDIKWWQNNEKKKWISFLILKTYVSFLKIKTMQNLSWFRASTFFCHK